MTGSATPPDFPLPDHDLLQRIGAGAYGEVWLARNRTTGTQLALKLVRRSLGESSKAFEREYNGIRQYEPISRTDAALMPIWHVGRDPAEGEAARFYYVMELADAVDSAPAPYIPRTLSHDLAARHRLSIPECLELGLALASALAALHRHGLLHRDIKPSNIIYVQGQPKLADIGLVERTDATASVVGTVGYLAPEGPCSPRADLYSLGKVLYEASTGKDRQRYPEPATELPPGEDPELGAELNEIILRACQPDPAQRYPTAEALRDDLRLLQAGQSIRRLRKAQRRARLSAVFAVGVTVLGGLAFLIQKTRESAIRERLTLVQAQADEQRRQVLMRDADRYLNPFPIAGWSTQAITKFKEAAAIRVDDALREEAIAAIGHVDARLTHELEGFSASSVAFDPAGERLAVGGMLEEARLLSLQTGQWSSLGSKRPNRVAFTASGHLLQFVVEGPGHFRLLDLSVGSDLGEFRLPIENEPVSWPPWVPVPTALCPDPPLVAGAVRSAEGHGRFAAWDAATGRKLIEGSGIVFSLVFSPDGSLLAAGDNHGRITVWSTSTGQIERELHDRDFSIRSLAFTRDRWPAGSNKSSPTDWVLAAGDETGRIAFWDVARGKLRGTLIGSHYHIYALAFSRDGTLLASSGRNETRIWDWSVAQLILSIPKRDAHTGLAFSPDGSRLAISNQTGFGTGSAQLYELTAPGGIQILRGLGDLASKLVFSADGQRLAGLTSDFRVLVWRTATGRLEQSFASPKSEGQLSAVLFLQFDPQGKILAAGGDVKGAAWDLDKGELVLSWEHDRVAQRWKARNELTGEMSSAATQPPGWITYGFDRSGQLLQAIVSVEPHLPTGETAMRTRLRWRLHRLPNFEALSVAPDHLWPYPIQRGCVLVNDARHLLIYTEDPSPDKHRSGRTNFSLGVFEAATGQPVWTNLPGMEHGVTHHLDPSLSIVVCRNGSGRTAVIEIESGRILQESITRDTNMMADFSGSTWIEQDNFSRSFVLKSSTLALPTLSFNPGFSQTHVMARALSREGHLFAYARADHSVVLCNLPALREDLHRLGLHPGGH